MGAEADRENKKIGVCSVEVGFKGFVAQSFVLLLGELRVPGQN